MADNFENNLNDDTQIEDSNQLDDNIQLDDYIQSEDDIQADEEDSPKGKGIPTGVKILFGTVILILILAGVGYGILKSKLGKINRTSPEDEIVISKDEETFEVDATEEGEEPVEDTIAPEDVVWDNVDINVMQDADVKNILLIGQDRRPGQGRQRSDSMIICSINKKTGKITLCSLMRDMYVPIPSFSDNRINAAYVFGGMKLLDQVIENDFGVHIDGNIEVDFDGFVEAMSVVGPLDIELKDYEVEYMNKSSWSKGSGFDVESWNLHEGVNSLTPEQALVYSRIRYVGNSDWERTDRQRRVLMAAFNKLKGNDIFTLLDMADEILPCLTTDMTDSQILGYVYTVASSGIDLGENYRLPVEGTYSCENIRGMAVLVPSLSANADALAGYLYGE